MTNKCEYFVTVSNIREHDHLISPLQATFYVEDLRFLKESFCSLLDSPLQVTGTVVNYIYVRYIFLVWC